MLAISNREELRKLILFAPQLCKTREVPASGQKVSSLADLISDYPNYKTIASVLRQFYGNGEKLDFKRILRMAGIEITESQIIPHSVKSRMQSWRNGIKPAVAQRAEALAEVKKCLYGN